MKPNDTADTLEAEGAGKRPKDHLEAARYPYEFAFTVFEIEFLRELFIACRKSLFNFAPDLRSVFENDLEIVLP